MSESLLDLHKFLILYFFSLLFFVISPISYSGQMFHKASYAANAAYTAAAARNYAAVAAAAQANPAMAGYVAAAK